MEEIQLIINKHISKRSLSKEIIAFFIEFAEGRISSELFWNNYLDSPKYSMFLMHYSKYITGFHNLFESFESYSKINMDAIQNRIHLFWMIKHLLKQLKIKCVPFHPEEDKFLLLSQAVPEWLDTSDYSMIQSILSRAPENLSNEDLIIFAHNEFGKVYRFRSSPPKWLQNPEWPLVNGVPLMFIEQDGDPDNITKSAYEDRINYSFFDEETDRMVIITQYD